MDRMSSKDKKKLLVKLYNPELEGFQEKKGS